MSAVVAVVLGVVGIWLLAGFLLFYAWISVRYPWVFWVVLIPSVGGLMGLAIYDDFIATG